MLGVVMFARGMREEDIVPAIMTGELPKNRGRVKAYENFEMLHEQLLEQLKERKSTFKANQDKFELENFLLLRAKKRRRTEKMAPAGDNQYQPEKLSERKRDNLVRNAREYVALHLR